MQWYPGHGLPVVRGPPVNPLFKTPARANVSSPTRLLRSIRAADLNTPPYDGTTTGLS